MWQLLEHLKVLAIDIGNTRIKVGFLTRGGMEFEVLGLTRDCRHPDFFQGLYELFGIGEMIKAGSIHCCGVASVNPEALEHFLSWIDSQSKVNVVIINSRSYPYSIQYLTPETLGADRLCDAFGGFSRHGGPLVVVDFGTAVTLNLVDKDGSFLGGAILPGPELMTESLNKGTARLPHISMAIPQEVIGHSTTESIASGASYGLISMVDGLIERFEEQLGLALKVVATGGAGADLRKLSRRIESYHQFLTLEGAARLAIWNRSRD
jgi:type III pantothenate kinase